jgi:hypothetical protein
MKTKSPDTGVYREPHKVRASRVVPYPFHLLSMRQRMWLRALRCGTSHSLRDTFHAIGERRDSIHRTVARWMDDPAFQDALYITLRRMKQKRAERVLDAVIRAVVCQPL